MTVVADIERPALLFGAPREGQTLDDVLSGVWEDLRANRTAGCPVCGGALAPRFGSGPAAVGGRCTTCATTLA